MAKKTSSTRSTPRAAPRPVPKQRPSRAGAILRRAVGGLLSFSRPRTAAETLALLFSCMAVVSLAAFGAGSARARAPQPAPLIWCAVLLAMALASRLSPWWRAELRGMTPERARNYVASLLLLFVALSVSWHLVGVQLGLDAGYPLPSLLDSAPAAWFVLGGLAALGVALLLGLPLGAWLAMGGTRLADSLSSARERRTLETAGVEPAAWEEIEDEPPDQVPENGGDVPRIIERQKRQLAQPPPAPVVVFGAPGLPPIDIFAPPPKAPTTPIDLELKATRIEETLASFNVSARVVGHHCGPVVTQFDVRPEPGVPVRKITSLQNDLALALAAPTIRIQAPVPGKPVVGIEIPNTSASSVALRELLESEAYISLDSPLKVALGKDVAGNPEIIDLAKMPHLLIAGATGSGKSVCVNDIIACLLFQNTPEQVRLMMVDPKMVELTVYNGVPHLLSPVVTEMEKVVGVLQWALREMERRYQLFAGNTVRNIQRYNEKMTGAGLKPLPYIVLIVDELADLMMVSPEDVEEAICRLAQLARAAGIHLVIATQRPSVDVVTGLIKANFPARIAFAMTSQVDSRTILDTAGADKLLGRGDMLYLPPDAPKPRRLQGAYLSEHEIEQLVDFWKRSPLQAIVERVSQEEFAAAERAAAAEDDELLKEAVRVVREFQTASVSLLQRRLRIGYARAARLMDQLEAHRVVGPADGSKQRPVLDDAEYVT